MDALDAIFGRRSTGRLHHPAPDPDEMRTILRAAAAAPDHGQLRPFRFIVLEGAAKDAFGQVLASAYDARCAEIGAAPLEAKRQKELTKLGRAPLVLVVAAVQQPSDSIPWGEQVAAADAAAQNALLAATALGYGSIWRTGEPCGDPRVKAALGLRDDDAVVGFLYVGSYDTAGAPPPNDPGLDGLVSTWSP